MAILNVAYTGTISPADASPKLTAAQVWAGLVRKVRHGELFVPAIEKTTVTNESVSDEKTRPDLPPGTQIIVRSAKFKDGEGPHAAQLNNSVVEETCVLFAPNRVDFLQPDGSTISNIISEGAGGASDLRMTYAFSWRRADLDESKDQAAVEHMRGTYQQQAKVAVEKSIESLRRMVVEGSLG